jgi:hypothetical protein
MIIRGLSEHRMGRCNESLRRWSPGDPRCPDLPSLPLAVHLELGLVQLYPNHMLCV